MTDIEIIESSEISFGSDTVSVSPHEAEDPWKAWTEYSGDIHIASAPKLLRYFFS
jgi:hypothetical protein